MSNQQPSKTDLAAAVANTEAERQAADLALRQASAAHQAASKALMDHIFADPDSTLDELSPGRCVNRHSKDAYYGEYSFKDAKKLDENWWFLRIYDDGKWRPDLVHLCPENRERLRLATPKTRRCSGCKAKVPDAIQMLANLQKLR